MKKTIFFLICFLGFPCLIFAGPLQRAHMAVIASQSVATGGGSCPSGTYDIAWDGDEGTELNACVNSGASTSTGTNDGTDRISAVGQSGNGFVAGDDGHYAVWDIPNFNATTGTFCFDVYVDSSSDPSDDANLMELSNSQSDSIYIEWRSNGKLRLESQRGSTYANVTSASTPSNQAWHRICCAYRNDGGGSDDFAIAIDDYDWTSADVEDNTLTFGTFSTNPDEIAVGQYQATNATWDAINIRTDNVFYIPGTYKANHPLGDI